MSRRSFLLGHLSGLVLGALLMWGSSSFREPRPVLPKPVTVIPLAAPAVEPLSPAPPDELNRWSKKVPPEPVIPPDWGRREFNGRPVYLIPLANRR